MVIALLAFPAGRAHAQPDDPNAAAPESAPAAAGQAAPALSHSELSGDVDRLSTYDIYGNRDPHFSRWNPYQQNPLKADIPVFGNSGFLELIARFNSNAKDVHGLGNNLKFDDTEKQNLVAGFEIKKDDDTFFPSPIKFRLLGNFQIINPPGNNVQAIQNGALQEAVLDVKVFEIGGNFNLSFFEAGVRPFKSDLNGLILNDTVDEGRLFGELRKNLWRYSVAYIRTLPKDPRSNLISFNSDLLGTHQTVAALNVQRDDLIPGWNAEFTFHANRDTSATSPAQSADLNAEYAGVAFNGHVGRFIFQPAVYYAFGTDDRNGLSDPNGIVLGKQDISAYLGFLDVRYPMDYVQWRAGLLYTSGDRNPNDGKATGFDSISDSINLFGGPASFFVGQPIAVAGRKLVNLNSAIPSFRLGTRSNFVNPGILLANVGADFVMTPKLTAAVNVNHISFVNTSSLSFATGTPSIGKDVGLEGVVALRWRPFLNENFVVEAGGTRLTPGDGLKTLVGKDSATAVFLNVLAVY
jgi:hypothetical protein